MASRLVVTLLSLALASACGTSRVVRLDTGKGAPREYRPPTSNKSVKLGAEEFEEALTQWVVHAPLSVRPAQQGWLVRAAYPGKEADTGWKRLMSQGVGGLCEEGQRGGECLSLLDDVLGLSEWDKLGVALGLSLEPMKESISRAVKDTLAPQLFYTVIATGLVSWVVLAANPEPVFTKGAAIVSALLLVYLGVETFLELVEASRELKRASDRATTPKELSMAGQRFADRVGPELSRLFVLATTVAVSYGMSGGAAWLASRVSMLPRFPEAATLGASQVGIQLAHVGEVRAVAVSTQGNIAIALAPGVVVMMGRGTSSGSSPAAHEGDDVGKLREVYNGVTHAPGYPPNFRNIQNGTTRHPVSNKELLGKLREIEPGNWSKVYKDGWSGSDRISLHYFESPSGKVFHFKVKQGWSNQ